MDPVFFKNKSDLRKWFMSNHKKARELLLGYYKTTSGHDSVSWPDSVDEALCVGWIDGVRKSIDDISHTIRFTPRKPGSIWSAVNIAKVEQLTNAGLMQAEGLAAFEKRKEQKSKIYSYENEKLPLAAVFEKQFKSNKKAWAFFSKVASSYKKVAIYSIMSAKQEATRARRLEALVQACEKEGKFWLYKK